MTTPVLPGGDPDLLEQLADQLTGRASQADDLAVTTASTTRQVSSGAEWTGNAADAYSGFTTAMSRGLGRTPAPLDDIATAVRSYAGVLRTAQARAAAYDNAVRQAQASGGDPASLQAASTAQADADVANAQLEAAGQQAAVRVQASAVTLDGAFAPEGVLRGTIEEIHTVLGATGADGALWALGRGAEQAKQFMDKLPTLEEQWLHDLVPWGKSASQDEFDSAVQRWWTKADAAEVFGEEFKSGTRVLGLVSRFGRLAGGPIAIAGDVSTMVDPPQTGAAGMADRVMAGTNGVVVAGDTAGALGEVLGVEALADLSLGPIGVGIAVGTGLYLAGAYAYKHWAWFRQDLAQPVGHAVARVASDVGHDLGDAAGTVASWF